VRVDILTFVSAQYLTPRGPDKRHGGVCRGRCTHPKSKQFERGRRGVQTNCLHDPISCTNSSLGFRAFDRPRVWGGVCRPARSAGACAPTWAAHWRPRGRRGGRSPWRTWGPGAAPGASGAWVASPGALWASTWWVPRIWGGPPRAAARLVGGGACLCRRYVG